MKKKYQKLSIIIPAYNEETYILETIERVLAADTLGLTREIIVVDDNSEDDTVAVLKKYIKQKRLAKTIMVLEQTENGGKGRALQRGFSQASGDIVLIQDADYEYNPADYPDLLKPFFEYGADVVYGSRFISSKPRRVLYFYHYVANISLTFLSNLFSNLNVSDMETGYKVFRGDLIRSLAPKLRSRRFGFEPEITALLGKRKDLCIYEVGISYKGRTYAEGKKIGLTDGLKAVWQIIYYNIFN